jgi:L-2-hydroxyglutarate oxidase LhgO
VVATEEGERAAVERIAVQAEATASRAAGCWTAARRWPMEPQLNAVMALLRPRAGSFDSHSYMLALQAGIEDAAGWCSCLRRLRGRTPLAGAAGSACAGAGRR